MFYTFNQNNSGGSFTHNETNGIGYVVVIEADALDQAIYKAESIGIYFNGVDAGRDCECCGDRWDAPWEDSGTEVPMSYREPLILNTENSGRWGIWSYVHYKDGTVLKISGQTATTLKNGW